VPGKTELETLHFLSTVQTVCHEHRTIICTFPYAKQYYKPTDVKFLLFSPPPHSQSTCHKLGLNRPVSATSTNLC